MRQYIATLFCRRNKWHYEVTIEAESLGDAQKQAQRDYADKATRVVNVVAK